MHSSSSALKDYRDYAGITRSKSLNLRRPTCMCTLTSFESERGCESVGVYVCVCVLLPFLRDLQVNLPSGCTAKAAHSAGRDKNSKKGKLSCMKTTRKHCKRACFDISHRIITDGLDALKYMSRGGAWLWATETKTVI